MGETVLGQRVNVGLCVYQRQSVVVRSLFDVPHCSRAVVGYTAALPLQPVLAVLLVISPIVVELQNFGRLTNRR